MQVARKHMPVHAPCIGIDLVPIRPIPGCVSIVGDITKDSARADLRRSLREAHNGRNEKVDAVLNDGSPNMGKAWLQDAYTQSELTLAALKLATEFLTAGGCFVTKVFRSNDYNSLLFVMNQLFERVNATKPTASRAESAEIYVLCIGYRAPRSIDPRLLNPKYVFKEMGKEKAGEEKPDLFLNTVMKDMKKRKRSRGGYEDGDMTLFKRISVLKYCRTVRPVAMMVESSQFSFDVKVIEEDVGEEDAKRVVEVLKSMPETTVEVLHCCEDLKVLARQEFKLLLKWRAAARTVLEKVNLLQPQDVMRNGKDDAQEAANEDNDKSSNDDEDGEDDKKDGSDSDEEDINEEFKKVRTEELAKDKRRKRKANKLRNALQRKIDMKIILPETNDETGVEAAAGGLFSINTAKRAVKHGIELADVPADDPRDADDEGSEAEEDKPAEAKLPYEVSGNCEQLENRAEAIEEDLDRWYKAYLSRKKYDKNGIPLQESKERRRVTKRKALREAYEKRINENGDEEKQDAGNSTPELVIDSSESSDEEISEDIVVNPSAMHSREAALWFSQPMFEDVTAISSDDNDDDRHLDGKDSKGRIKDNGDGSDMDVEIVEREGEDIHMAARLEARKAAAEQARKAEVDNDGFDVVPNEINKKTDGDAESSDSSFHSSDYDTDEKAELVAIGRRMRRSKTEAMDVLDEAYNRYTFDDPIDLPRWFADPDPEYRKRQAPVTKEQVAEMKEYIKSLQAAPTKKEAEAKARQRARTAKKMEAMKTKANNIAEQSDVPANSRMKAIEELYKQAMKKGGKKTKRKQYQVVRPNGRMNVGKNKVKGRKAMRGVQTKLVDKRMKADKRGIAKANAKKKSGKR